MSLISKAWGAVRQLAPAILPFTPLGPVAGRIIGGLVAPRARPASLMAGEPTFSIPGVGGGGDGGMVRTAGPVVSGVIRGAGAAMRWLIGPRGIARNAVGKIVGVMRGESLFRNKRVIALAKQIGIQGAAVALGITIAEVAEMFVAEAGKKRRTRGITGRDIKCTRRTLGKIRSVQRMIGLPRSPRARARPSVAVRCD